MEDGYRLPPSMPYRWGAARSGAISGFFLVLAWQRRRVLDLGPAGPKVVENVIEHSSDRPLSMLL